MARNGSFEAAPGIGLWIAPAEGVEGPAALSSLDMLSGRERRRYHRLGRGEDRRRFLAAHVLLRKALSRAAGGRIDPHSWRFSVHRQGKPSVDRVTGLPLVHFNLSHSQQLIAVAASPSCPVGVDVEPLCRAVDAPVIDLLAPGEQRWLRNRPPETRDGDVIRIWTVKEAYAKLLGLGLALDFSSFQVMFDPAVTVRTAGGEPLPDSPYFETCEIHAPDSAYHLALAAWTPPGREAGVEFHMVDSPFTYSPYMSSARSGDPSLCVNQEREIPGKKPTCRHGEYQRIGIRGKGKL